MPTLLLYGSLLECGGGTSIHYSFFLFYLYRASKRCVSPLRRDRLHVQFRFCGSTARQTVNELFFLLISCIGPAIDRSVPCCLSISTIENPAHVASRDCFTALQPQQMTSRPDFTFSRDLRRPCSSLSNMEQATMLQTRLNVINTKPQSTSSLLIFMGNRGGQRGQNLVLFFIRTLPI